MKKEVNGLLRAKSEVLKKLGRGGIAAIAKERGVDKAAVSRWVSAKRVTRVDKENMEAAIALIERKREEIAGMTKQAMRA